MRLGIEIFELVFSHGPLLFSLVFQVFNQALLGLFFLDLALDFVLKALLLLFELLIL